MSGFDRERHLKPLLALGLAVILACGVWAYTSYDQALTHLERKTASARNELQQLRDSLQEYRSLEAELKTSGGTGSSNSGRNLISTVENATQQIGARSQLLYVRPQPDKTRDETVEEGVEIRLEKLQLHQLVELLYQFKQANQGLRVSQLRVRTGFENPELLDAVMILSRFKEVR